MRLVIILALVGLAASAGCMSTREKLMNAGYDPAYTDGFVQGESSGYAAAGNPYYMFSKDTRRYDVDAQYRQGWNDGYDVTKTRYSNIGRR